MATFYHSANLSGGNPYSLDVGTHYNVLPRRSFRVPSGERIRFYRNAVVS